MFSRQGLPLFATFLIWGTGSGAQTLGRPLFAYELADSIFLVTLLIAALGLSRIISAPLTGFLTDRIGRKPLAVIGAALRGAMSFAVLWVDNYAAFFVVELIGNTGVSMWQTTSQVVVADMSTPENRGRAVAMRNSSLRLGQIMGPVLGGVIAATWGLQEVFVVNGVSKFLVMFITLYMIGETRPARERRPAAERTGLRADLLPIVLSRAFIALGLTTIAAALIGQGVVQVMFPVAGKEEAGLDESQIGLLIGVASLITLICSFPNGMLVDRFGRKTSLVPGLLFAAGASVLLSFAGDFNGALAAIVVFGLAQAMTMGSTQAFRHGPRAGGQARRVPRRLVGVPELRLRRGPADGRRRRRSLGVRDGVHRGRGLPRGRGAGDGCVRAGDARPAAADPSFRAKRSALYLSFRAEPSAVAEAESRNLSGGRLWRTNVPERCFGFAQHDTTEARAPLTRGA